MSRIVLAVLTAIALGLAPAGCGDNAQEVPDAQTEYTCAEYAEITTRDDIPVSCCITGNDYELTGVWWYDDKANMTCAQDVKNWDGELGVFGQIDQWTPGCHWFPCEELRCNYPPCPEGI